MLNICIKINKGAIESVKHTTFLGVYIEEFLNFKMHIDERTEKYPNKFSSWETVST